jgi:DNA polymerase-1
MPLILTTYSQYDGEEVRLSKKLFIIDGSACIYRAFHAIPAFTNSKGFPTNAIYGYIQSIKKILKTHQPDYIGVAFDMKGPTVRHEKYEAYKAERPPMPDELSLQIPRIKEATAAFGIPVMELSGYEADDIIAALVREYKDKDLKIFIVTGDKDLYQLVDENVSIVDLVKDKTFGPLEAEEKFGVPPNRIRDLMAFAGDKSDNVPGVPGVGVKTAAKLIKEFGSFDGVYERLDEVKAEKLRNKLKEFKEQAELSKELVTLYDSIEVEAGLSELALSEPNRSELEALYREFEFTKLLKELGVIDSNTKSSGERSATGGDLLEPEIIKDLDELKKLVEKIKESSRLAISLSHTDNAELTLGALINGLAIALDGETDGYFIPFFNEELIVKELAPVFSSSDIDKIATDSKGLHIFAGHHGFNLKAVVMDTSLASYLLNPAGSHGIEDVAYEYLELSLPILDKKNLDDPVLKARVLAGSARAAFNLAPVLAEALTEASMEELFNDMELPLAGVLAAMELRGIRVEAGDLKELSIVMASELDLLETELYKTAGEEFNINSPKQLSVILFEKLGLKPVKKTKTGFSTDESVLTKLAEAHEVPALIIKYRQIAKLKSTYVESLLKLIDPGSRRVHTSFNQSVTTTGRLSSSRPNLQNIPVKGEYAARIRAAFVADKGYKLFSADYSQIELRLVAHLSEDPLLVESFLSGEDIHKRTASEVFDIMPELVTSEMRRRAKAINFGIIYGMGPHGLASELKVSMKEAKNYIDQYFNRYMGVRGFLDKTIAKAKELGYTETIFGRRRYIPELQGPTDQAIRFGERMAVNAPVQGSAADIIKVALINIERRLTAMKIDAKMLLQIHDELVFEVMAKDADELAKLVIEEMESVVELRVPLLVNTALGESWEKVG